MNQLNCYRRIERNSVKLISSFKLGLCPECSDKLNYHHKNKEVTIRSPADEASTSRDSEISQKVDDFLHSLLV